jgi:hypothetical protein
LPGDLICKRSVDYEKIRFHSPGGNRIHCNKPVASSLAQHERESECKYERDNPESPGHADHIKPENERHEPSKLIYEN